MSDSPLYNITCDWRLQIKAKYPPYTIQRCVNSVRIKNTEIKHFGYRDFSVVKLFQVQVFRFEGLGILGTLGFYTILKPKINLKHTFNDNLCLKTILSDPYMENIEMFELENQKSSDQDRKIHIGIIKAEIRIEATQKRSCQHYYHLPRFEKLWHGSTLFVQLLHVFFTLSE